MRQKRRIPFLVPAVGLAVLVAHVIQAPAGAASPGLTLAEGLTVDRQGNIYAAETLPGRIGDLVTGSTVRKLVKN